MRLLIQGTVVTDAATGKSRVEVNVKPDLTFAAAKSDIWTALGLDGLDHDAADNSSLSSGASSASSKGLATANLGALSKLKQQAGEADGGERLERERTRMRGRGRKREGGFE
jgi:hypothetical protein